MKVSPISKEIVFENTLLEFFNKEKVAGAFVFYIPKEGDVKQFDRGLCGHQLLTLAEHIKEATEERLGKGECEE